MLRSELRSRILASSPPRDVFFAYPHNYSRENSELYFLTVIPVQLISVALQYNQEHEPA